MRAATRAFGAARSRLPPRRCVWLAAPSLRGVRPVFLRRSGRERFVDKPWRVSGDAELGALADRSHPQCQGSAAKCLKRKCGSVPGADQPAAEFQDWRVAANCDPEYLGPIAPE